MAKFTVVLCYVFILKFSTRCCGQLIDGSLFATVIRDITNNALGVNEIQAYYNSLTYGTMPVEGQSLAVEIASSLSNKFSNSILAVEKLKDAVEQDISSFTSSRNNVECCQEQATEFDERFKHKVNVDGACVTLPQDRSATMRFPTTRITEVMKENYRDNPQLKWQYLATEDGILLNYPSFKFSTCTDYDPRYRPFYVSSATPVEKDLVIVIDTSGSMGTTHNSKSLMQIAKEAAISVIQTLNPNDRFAIVSFSSTSRNLGSSSRSCINSYMLSEATPMNIEFFEGEINSLRTSGATNYEVALDTAFRFFETSNTSFNGEIREKVILFLTDGEKTEGDDPYDLISARNGALGNQVVILTYGLGVSLSQNALLMLSQMASQANNDRSKGEVQAGIFEHITDPSDLRSAMASYYNFFSTDTQQRGPSFTVPYIDLFGLGLLTSLCLPVYKPDNKLFGVVCSDLTMSNLLSDITYFRQGENSYAFIIDGRGRTLMHPLLPLPSQASDDPIYVDIQHLERAGDAQEIITSMKSGLSGNKTFMSSRTVSRGYVLYEGIQTESLQSSYHWMPVPNSNFSLCIVAGTGDTQATLDALQPNPEAFNYHRRDMLAEGENNCVHFNRYATKDNTAVMISPGGFINPSLYLDSEETVQQIQKYTNYLTGASRTNPGFKPTIINSVTASFRAEEIWKAKSGNQVIWRFIGHADGVMRMFPAVQLAKNYDHTRRPWYERTVANKGKIVISSPYRDLWGSGYLITLSTAITEPSASGSTIAVVGTDTTIAYLYQQLLSLPAYSNCRQFEYHCFLVDDSGFIIVHWSFVEPDSKDPEIENVHITVKEPAIADDLARENSLTQNHCIDFENIKLQFTYRITTPPGGLDRTSSNARYEIRPVPDTNVYIVIQRNQNIPLGPICCQFGGSAPDAVTCSSSLCGCLCYRPANFNYCNNEYQLLADAASTCAPRTPELETESIHEGDKIRGLPRCYETNCEGQGSQNGCHGISGCSWCSRNQDLNDLSSPYCTRQERCYFGIEGLTECLEDECEVPEEGGKEEKGSGGVVGGVIGGLTGGIVAVTVGICVARRRGHRGCNRNTNTNAPPVNNAGVNQNPPSGNVNPAYDNRSTVSYVAPQTNFPQYNTQQSYDSGSYPIQPSAPSQNIAPPAYDESHKHPIYP